MDREEDYPFISVKGSQCKLYPIDVEHGDSTLLECVDGRKQYFCLVDGGHKKHFQNLIQCLRCCELITDDNEILLDFIVVTHPDADHMNGITALLGHKKYKLQHSCKIIITKAFTEWKPTIHQDKFLDELEDATDTVEEISSKTYELIPGLILHFPIMKGLCFRRGGMDNPKYKDAKKYLSQRSTSQRPNNKYINSTSILTTVNRSDEGYDIVLTGDSYAGIIEEPLQLRGKTVVIFQVPHHGSEKNSNFELYCTFKANLYLISAGSRYNLPSARVLEGIIDANVMKANSCKIALTNSLGLSREKIDSPQGWSFWVKIYHINDRFQSESQERFIKWTPRAYIKEIKHEISTLGYESYDYYFAIPSSRHQHRQDDPCYEAKIIKVPLPHEPQLDGYLILESISGDDYRSATFLDNSKSHIFQYTDKEWGMEGFNITTIKYRDLCEDPLPFFHVLRLFNN